MTTTPYIKAIQERIQLTTAHRDQRLAIGSRPDKLLLLHALAPQTREVFMMPHLAMWLINRTQPATRVLPRGDFVRDALSR